MPATPAWLATAEAVLNRNIDACTPAVALARRLQGKTLQIDLAGLTRVRLAAGGGRVALLAGDDSPADAVILGSPLALLALLSGASPANARSPAQVRGDAEVAAQFRELLRLARPDWEEELSRRIGDWARNARRTVRENLAEYLQEESRDLVNRPELDEFLHGVDALRESTDRIDARLALLERSVKGAP